MTDPTDPSTASLRLSDAERERAAAALRAQATQGRLSDAELQQRVSAAWAAVTRGDLAPLFVDLPGGAPHLDDAASAAGPASGIPAAPLPGPFSAPAQQLPGRERCRWALALVSAMPFVALILFFITGNVWGYQYSWLWFLLIPLTGALAYGVDGGRRR